MQFRLRCEQCNRTTGFAITIEDQRGIVDSRKPRVVRVIVAKGE